MADIAFLLLIFFLVTTTLEVDAGLPRRLPVASSDKPSPIPERNLLQVLVKEQGAIMVRGKQVTADDLPGLVMDFLTNPTNSDDRPAMIALTPERCAMELTAARSETGIALWRQRAVAVAVLGAYREPPSGVQIIVTTANGTRYADFIAVQDALEQGITALRDSVSLTAFGKRFAELNEVDPTGMLRIQVVRRAVPHAIGEGIWADR
ncbi:MAG: biopolymer transporter ExbD [Flavobacteriales bacterium]|nr:biopolymer transporter ExbD [Flavobacteriales bacterium]